MLATAPEDFRLVRVAVLLFGTLVIYWAAETYVHWIATRTRGAARPHRVTSSGLIVGDGWPLVAACAVPVAFLLVEALLGIDTATALDVTLVVNVGPPDRHRLADGPRQWAQRACSSSPRSA